MKSIENPDICTYRGRAYVSWDIYFFPTCMYWVDFGKGRENKIACIRADIFYADDNVDIYSIFGNLDYRLINPDE